MDAIAGLDNRVVGAQQNLVRALARLQRNRAGDAVAAMIVGVDAQSDPVPAPGLRRTTATPPASVVTC